MYSVHSLTQSIADLIALMQRVIALWLGMSGALFHRIFKFTHISIHSLFHSSRIVFNTKNISIIHHTSFVSALLLKLCMKN